MNSLFATGLQRLARSLNDPSVTREDLVFRILPRWALEGLRSYFKVKSIGLEKIPLSGPAIIIANHSGFAGFDALMLANEVRRYSARKPKILTHKLWFKGDLLRKLSSEFGFVEANLELAEQAILDGNILLFFPEGAAGNFKPTSKRYKLQEFKRGFLRLALKTGAPVIPAIVIGAEESNINLGRVSLKKIPSLPIPLPLNLVPLPVEWRLFFYDSIDLSGYSKEDVSSSEKLRALARKVRHMMQNKIVTEIRKRRELSLEELEIEEHDLP